VNFFWTYSSAASLETLLGTMMPSLRRAVAEPPSAFESAIEAACRLIDRPRATSAARPVSFSDRWTLPPTRSRNVNAPSSSVRVNPARWLSLRSAESTWPL
jgi:hypothetical protein